MLIHNKEKSNKHSIQLEKGFFKKSRKKHEINLNIPFREAITPLVNKLIKHSIGPLCRGVRVSLF